GLRSCVLVNGQVANRVQGRGIIDRVDGDGKGAHDSVVAQTTVIDGDGNSGRAGGEGCGSKSQSAGRVWAGVLDGGIGQPAGVARSVSYAKGLALVGRP